MRELHPSQMHHGLSSPVGTYARYVGRVGALAVALGIGGALAGGHGLAAATPEAGNETSSDATTVKAGPHTSESARHGVGARRTPTLGPSNSTVRPSPATNSGQRPAAVSDGPGSLPASARAVRSIGSPVDSAPAVASASGRSARPKPEHPTESRTVTTGQSALAPTQDPGNPAGTSLVESIVGWVRRTFDNATPTLTHQTVSLTLDGSQSSTPVSFQASDADGDALTYAVAHNGIGTDGGTLAISGDSFTYTPGLGWDGLTDYTDTFTITASDAANGFHIHGLSGLLHMLSFGLLGAAGDSATNTVSVKVVAAQVGPPVVTDPGHPYTAIAARPEDPAGSVRGQIVANDTHQPITYSYNGPTTTEDGSTITVDPDGSFLYAPSEAARHQAAADDAPVGADTFSFTVTATNSRGAATDIPISLTIAPANEEPTAPDQPPATVVDHSAGGQVTSTVGYVDPDGDTLRYTNPNGPTWTTAGGGTVTVDPLTGDYTYTPDPADRLNAYLHPDQNTDTFDVTITDGHGASHTVTITVAIDPAAALLSTAKDLQIPDGTYPTGKAAVGPDGSGYATYYDQATRSYGIVVIRPDGTRTVVPLDDQSFEYGIQDDTHAGPGGRLYQTTDHSVVVVNPDNTVTVIPLAGKSTGNLIVTADGHAYQFAADPGIYHATNTFSITIINPDASYTTVPLTNTPSYGGAGNSVSLSEEGRAVAPDGTLFIKTYRTNGSYGLAVDIIGPDASHTVVALPTMFGQNCSCSGITIGPDGRAYVLGNTGAVATLITVNSDGTYTTTYLPVAGASAYGNATGDADGNVYLTVGPGDLSGIDTMVVVHPDQTFDTVALDGDTVFLAPPVALSGGRAFQLVRDHPIELGSARYHAVIVNPDGSTDVIPGVVDYATKVVVGADGRAYVYSESYSPSQEVGVIDQGNGYTAIPAPSYFQSVVADAAGYAYITSSDFQSTTVTVVRPDGSYSAVEIPGTAMSGVSVTDDGEIWQSVRSNDNTAVTAWKIAVARG